METEQKNVWDFLEEPTRNADKAKDLFQWSLNYDHGSRPWDLFLDLIGYSAEQYGTNLHNGDYSKTVGYLEASYLADALTEWSDNPHDVETWVTALMECEG